MKRIYKLLSVACLLATMTSCGDFLDRSAQNLIIPKTATEYKEMLQGDAYFTELFGKTGWVQMMTDDVEFQEAYSRYSTYKYTGSNIEYYGDAYTWQQEIENDYFSDEAFLYLYKQIKVANLCIEGMESAEGTADERKITLGQAYFTRAMAYFYLANLYGPAYNEAKATDLCVPLVLSGNISPEEASRATVGDIWGQMVSDIDNAMENLKDEKTGDFYNISYKAALVIAMRIHLFMEDYDKAILYGEQILALQPALCDITSQTMATKKYSYTLSKDVANFFTTSNPEIIWNFNTAPSYNSSGYTFYGLFSSYGSGYVGYCITPSSQSVYDGQQTIISMYTANEKALTGDRRLLYWFICPSKKTSASHVWDYNTYRSAKYDRDDDLKMLMQCFRTGEVYVTLAEAYARRNKSGDADKAIGYLNTLRSNRIKPYTALTAADFATNNDLIQFCWDERRRELCFEECHRWWDMRREGQKKVVHRYNECGTSGNNFQVYTLEDHDPAFVLNFPLAERKLSPSMPTNSRPQRTGK
jgi:tetratricopeptide (TPR) repeat protein